jgi:hypothetical protein
MFSLLRPSLLYENVEKDVMEHDVDIDAEEWEYDGRTVYKGSLDTQYDLSVYWLYDENLSRVGLCEHEHDHPEVYKVLWYHDNPFATLFQNPEWKPQNKTLWSLMTREAYSDCLADDFKTVFEKSRASGVELVTPEYLMKNSLDIYQSSILFLDEFFMLYSPPKLQEQRDACEQEQLEPAQTQADQSASQGEPHLECPLADSPPEPLPPQP